MLFQDMEQESEILSPYRLCLCLLIHCTQSDAYGWAIYPTHAVRVANFLMDKITVYDKMTEPSLYELVSDLHTHLTGIGAELVTVLEQRLEALNTPQDLIDCCEACWSKDLLSLDETGVGVLPSSPAGRFLRRCKLCFQGMPFEAMVHMLSKVCGYYEVYTGLRDRGGPLDAAQDPTACDVRPAAELETYLEHRMGMIRQLTGVLPVATLEREIDLLEEHAGGLPSVAAARVQTANLGRTFGRAVEALLSFHDRSRAAMWRGVVASKPLQQALLAMSQQQAEYGRLTNALQALLEAVDVDQGSGDPESLVTCLLQLCALLRAGTPIEGQAHSTAATMQGAAAAHYHLLEQLLHCVVAQALTHRLPAFFAAGLLALGELCVLHTLQPTGGATAGAVTEHVCTGGRCISYTHPAAAAAPGAAAVGVAGGSSTAGAGGISTRTFKAMSPSAVGWSYEQCIASMAFACSVAATSYETAPGIASGERSLYTQHMDCFSSCQQSMAMAVAGGVEETRSRMLLLWASVWRWHGSCTLVAASAARLLAASVDDAEETLHAYALLALVALDRRGPAAAQRVLAAACQEFPVSKSVHLSMARAEVEFWTALWQGAVHRASACAARMCAVPHPLRKTDLQIRAQAEELLLVAMVESGRAEAAWRAGVTLLANCVAHGLQAEAAAVQLMIARALARAEQLALALPYALNALYHATAQHLDELAARVAVVVASVDMATDARALMNAFLPFIDAQGCLTLQAEAHMLLAESFFKTLEPGVSCRAAPPWRPACGARCTRARWRRRG